MTHAILMNDWQYFAFANIFFWNKNKWQYILAVLQFNSMNK